MGNKNGKNNEIQTGIGKRRNEDDGKWKKRDGNGIKRLRMEKLGLEKWKWGVEESKNRAK